MITVCVLAIFYILCDAKESTDHFTTLSMNTRKFHGTSGVFVLYDDRRFGLKEQRNLIETIRSYSNRNYMSQAISYDNLEKAHELRGKSLFTLNVSTKKSLDRIVKASKITAISTHPWLLFTNVTDFHCNKLGKDFFKLRIDTKLMVKCNGDNVLRWCYGIYEDRTEIFNLAKWNSEKNELQFTSEKSMVKAKTNFKGITLNVAEPNEEFNRTHTKLATYQRTLMEDLSYFGNFHTNVVVSEHARFGYFDEKTRKWIGIVKDIIGKKVDISSTLSSVSCDRTEVVDFTTPIMTSPCFLYARLPDCTEVPWAAYFKAFNSVSLITVGIFIIIFSLLLSFMKTKHRHTPSLTFLDNFIDVWGILNQQGTSGDTSISSIRVLYFVILVTALILNTVYSAAIGSYIAALEIRLPFSNYEEFVNDGSYKLIVLKYSDDRALIEENDTLITPLKSRLKDDHDLPATPMEAFQHLCDDRKTALYSSGMWFDELKPTPWSSKCTISRVKLNRVKYFSLVLPKNSPYTASMNHLVLRLREFGFLSRLKNRYLRTVIEIPEVQPNIIRFKEVVPILAILVVGVIVALLVYVLEVIVHHHHSRATALCSQIYCTKYQNRRKFDLRRNIKIFS